MCVAFPLHTLLFKIQSFYLTPSAALSRINALGVFFELAETRSVLTKIRFTSARGTTDGHNVALLVGCVKRAGRLLTECAQATVARLPTRHPLPVRFAQSKADRARPAPRGRARCIAPTPACRSRSALHPGVVWGANEERALRQPPSPRRRARVFDGKTVHWTVF